jgi:hypothetical protein
MRMSGRRAGERGNALIMVLVAIVLFALLIMFITRSSRTGSDMSAEQAALAADGIMRAGDDMNQAVQQILNAGGDVSKLSFQDAATGAAYANGSATAATTVFGPSGGGAKYPKPDTAWLDGAQSAKAFYGKWYFPNNVCVPYVGMGADGGGATTACNAAGATNNEVIAVLPYVSAAVCTRLDKSLGVTMCSGAPCAASATILPATGADEYTGSFVNGKMFYSSSAGLPFNAKHSGCIAGTGTSAGMYFYYRVLAER